MLGLHPWASATEIRRVYRSLARRFHPDGTEPSEVLFERYAEIYAVLRDPIRRAEYHATPEGFSFLDRHERAMAEAAGFAIPLEQTENTEVLGYDFYRIGSRDDDHEVATRWYEALIEDLGGLGYRHALRLCLTDGRHGYDRSTRVIYLPRTTPEELPEARQRLLSILSA